MSDRANRWCDRLWLLLWGLASSAWCLSASGQLSATFDEPTYLRAGLEHWRTGSYAGLMRLGTMPLPVDVTTLPLYLWERGHGVTLDTANDLTPLLPWARAMTLVFWWLLLAYGMRAGRQLAGPWAGRLAVALLACEPNLLAHATLATTDLAITACLFAFVYHFHAGTNEPWRGRVGLPMLWLAAAILAKASGLVFGPICMLPLEGARVLGSENRDGTGIATRLRRGVRWRELTVITLGALALVFLYCGTDARANPSFLKWAGRQPTGLRRETLLWLAEHLCIFPNAGSAIARQVTHNVRGHGVYLLGREDARALWYYFPVLLTIKASAALLVCLATALVVRAGALRNWACIAAAALAAFSLACRVQIGIRFMLPLLALAIVGISAALVAACHAEAIPWRRRLLGVTCVVAVAWAGTSAVRVWPEGLCHVNEFWGGTAAGYAKVSESNYDWGQGLPELERWHAAHPGPLALWYFGTDPAAGRLSAQVLPLHTLAIASGADVRRAVGPRRLAVSTTLLHCAPGNITALRITRDFLRSCRPIGRTTTFLIFDFTNDPPQAADGG
jgi:hypothetical protein